MILAGFFQTPEFYVIAAVLAAAVVAWFAVPHGKGPVETKLLRGVLGNVTAESEAENSPEATDNSADTADQSSARLIVECRPDGSVAVTRTALNGITESAAVSVAVTLNGFDLTIKERTAPGYSTDTPMTSATFVLDFLAPERYHVRYVNEDTGQYCVFTLPVRPGLRMVRPLKFSI